MNLSGKDERVASREMSVQNQSMGRKFAEEELHLLLRSNSVNIC